MPDALSLNLTRSLSTTTQYQAHAIRRSSLQSVRDIRRFQSEQVMTTPQDLGNHANLAISGTQSRKSPQGRLLDRLA